MVSSRSDPQAAPGELEEVRGLLNTWRIPNDLREPVDVFDTHAQALCLPSWEVALLRQLRDDLRAVVERQTDGDATLGRWIDHLGVRLTVTNGALRFSVEKSAAADVMVVVLGAIVSQEWPRLKACPDCRWVFYDHTRNGRKRWCAMNAGSPTGRSCGNIAKGRRYRERQRAEGG